MNNKFKSAFVERDFHGIKIQVPQHMDYVAVEEDLSVYAFNGKPSTICKWWQVDFDAQATYLGQLTTKEAIPVGWDESLVCYKGKS